MCGIIGCWNFDESPLERDLLLRMTRSLKHRGPDDHGTVLFRSVSGDEWKPEFSASLETSDGMKGKGGLGHTRLSVIDLSERARQPMANEDDSIWITYNGEIYNFSLLRDELVRKGHRFRSRTDSEVILHAYEEWGPDCLLRLNGMFAFGVLDLRKGELFLARDRLGIKPLYYCEHPNFFAFASEPKALFQHADVPRRLDPYALFDYLVLGYTPSPRSFFKDVRRLAPGHFLIRTLPVKGRDSVSDLIIKKYWDVRFGKMDFKGSEEEGEEQLRDLLADAVGLRMISDVPLGAFLSGGVDSSAIVSQMVRRTGAEVQTFSIGFSEPEYSELGFARDVSQWLNTRHTEEILDAEFLQNLTKILYFYDEPLADTSILPTFGVCGLARKHVTVCLSGDGGDELFGGYWQHGLAAKARYAPWIPRAVRPLAAILNSRNSGPFARFSGLAGPLFGPSVQDCFGVGAGPGDQWARRLLRPGLLRLMGSYTPYDTLNRHYLTCPARALPLDRIQYVDLKAYLPEDILTKVDRASMAFGLEVRVPFLDHRIVEFAARLPPAMRVREGRSKVILKEAFSPFLPAGVPNRAKQGFAIPEAPWLHDGCLSRIEQALIGPEARVSGVLVQEELPRLFTAFRDGSTSLGRLIWGLYILEEWMRLMDRYGGIDASIPQ